MTHVYVDTSVLLRVVLDEPDQIAEWEVFEDPVTSVLAEVEGLRVIDRATRKATHPRRKPLTEDEANAARTRLHQRDLGPCHIVPTGTRVAYTSRRGLIGGAGHAPTEPIDAAGRAAPLTSGRAPTSVHRRSAACQFETTVRRVSRRSRGFSAAGKARRRRADDLVRAEPRTGSQ